MAENLTDLYYLTQIIETNDFVFSQTTRRVRMSGKDGREGDKGERIKIFLGISVIDIEYQDSSYDQRIRIKGNIISGPEDLITINSTHTINLSINQFITIQKNLWLQYHFSLIKKAENSIERPIIGIIAIEKGLFTIATINDFKVNILIQERQNTPGKSANSKIRNLSDNNYFKKILNLIKNYCEKENINNIVLGGPGNYKNKFLEFFNEEWMNHKKNITLEDLSTGSSNSISELLNRKSIEKIAGEYQVIEEYKIISEFEKRLGMDFNKICYGLNHCLKAAEQGAIENILINESIIQNKNEVNKLFINDLLDLLEKTKSKLLIVNHRTENGIIVEKFGGMISLLRYALYFDD